MPKYDDITHQRFNRLTAIRHVGSDANGNAFWLCQCDCGNTALIRGERLRSGRTKSCGCLSPELGRRAHEEAVARRQARAASRPPRPPPKPKPPPRRRVVIRAKHGHARGIVKSRTYMTWLNMMHRCYYEKKVGFKNYGGRGITVCERWHTFLNFLADMGEKPPRLTIQRVNNDGNYEPGNCVWDTWVEQAKNRRKPTKNF